MEVCTLTCGPGVMEVGTGRWEVEGQLQLCSKFETGRGYVKACERRRALGRSSGGEGTGREERREEPGLAPAAF